MTYPMAGAIPKDRHMRKLRTFRRSKRLFKSARAAWMDILHRTGIPARRVVGKAHTRTHWVFKVR